ncbi:MAG: hypothetical protein WA734_16900, partial [Candidatus Acidiferrales bacterium]
RHARAPIHEVAISWWNKSGDEFRAAMQERSRSKVGRMARLRGEVEKTEPLVVLPSPTLSSKVTATVAEMRKAGAPESDVEAFLQGQAATTTS